MHLPNNAVLQIEEAKLRNYLLSESHPTGRAKARFFESFGFSIGQWSELRDALIEHIRSNPVVYSEDTGFGRKYIVDGELYTPDGREPRVRAVWFVRSEESQLRFVTAYPLKE